MLAILLSITAMLNISACINQPDTTKPDSSSDLSVVEPSGVSVPNGAELPVHFVCL